MAMKAPFLSTLQAAKHVLRPKEFNISSELVGAWMHRVGAACKDYRDSGGKVGLRSIQNDKGRFQIEVPDLEDWWEDQCEGVRQSA